MTGRRATRLAAPFLPLIFVSISLAVTAQDAPSPRLDAFGDPLPPGAAARIGTVRFRLPEDPDALTLSADGRLLAVLSTPKYPKTIVQVIDTTSGRVARSYEGEDDAMWLQAPLAFSADGGALLCLDPRAGVFTWDIEKGTWREVRGEVELQYDGAGAFSPDRSRVAVFAGKGDEDEGSLFLLDVATGKIVREFRGHGGLGAYPQGFSGDGRLLLTAGDLNVVRIWDVETGRQRQRIDVFDPHVEPDEDGQRPAADLWSATISPDGSRIAALIESKGMRNGYSYTCVAVLDRSTLEPVRSWHPGDDDPFHWFDLAHFSPDGMRLLTAGGKARLCNLADGSVSTPLAGSGDFAEFTADGDRFFLGGVDAFTMHFTDPDREAKEGTAPEIAPGMLALGFGADCGTILAGGYRGAVCLYDASSGRLRRRLDRSPDDAVEDGVDAVWSSPTGAWIVGTSEYGEWTRIWNAETGRRVVHRNGLPLSRRLASAHGTQVEGLDPRALAAHPDRLSCLAFSPDDRRVAIGRQGGGIEIVPLTGGKSRTLVATHEGLVAAVAFARERDRLHSFGWDGRLCETDLATHKPPLVQKTDLDALPALATFSHDGRLLACGDARGRLQVQDAEMGDVVLEGHSLQGRFSALSFTPDARRLLLRGATDRKHPGLDLSFYYRVWDLDHGREILRLNGRQGNGLFTGEAEGKMQVEFHVRGFDGPPNPWPIPLEAALSPDGRLIASDGSEGEVLLWEVATGRLVRRLAGDKDWERSPAFSPDGRLLATAYPESSGLVWETFPAPAPGAKKGSGPDGSTDLDAIWERLSEGDVPAAFEAMAYLVSKPGETVEFLEERTDPIPRLASEEIQRLAGDLESPEFSVRQRATTALVLQGALAREALESLPREAMSAERKSRLQSVLAAQAPVVRTFPSEPLRRRRLIQVLEMIGSEEATTLLRSLADGAPRAPQTIEARAAVSRLTLRSDR